MSDPPVDYSEMNERDEGAVLRLLGYLVAIFGIAGTLIVAVDVFDTSSSGLFGDALELTTAAKWSALFPGITVMTLGLILAAVARKPRP